ncbi:sensor histidine kinase [Paenibacillus brevis]|uniref:histidine kinase n=1 Tax=Paenibacillus brevis TaxID=2841508 RepID=A0ABS6FKU2_9BACL|nr:sensor histidine kinase [Paenibacillus brevis]MBU5670609.1 sensor histidine kinase [Paenibacillus brevis]
MEQASTRDGRFRLFPQKYGYFPYLWLVYIALPIINLQQETGLRLALGYVFIALFVITYRQLYNVTGTAFTWWLIVQMALILVMCLAYSPFNLYMGFFTANFIGWYSDHRKFRVFITAFTAMELGLIALIIPKMEPLELIFTLPFLILMLASPFGIRSMVRKQQLEQELDMAQQQIKELITREERMRIARDLHDTLGHTLSLITLKSQLVEKLIAKDPLRAQAEAKEIQQTSRAALRQVRELVSDMRASSIAEGIAEAREMLRAAGIGLTVEGDPEQIDVSPLSQNILSLCIKEAITNLVKHSQASHCRISIANSESWLQIEIEDNGIGLPPSGTGSCADDPEAGTGTSAGNGLKGMAERLSLIESSLRFSRPEHGKGTRLTVQVPFVIKDRKEEGAE